MIKLYIIYSNYNKNNNYTDSLLSSGRNSFINKYRNFFKLSIRAA